MRPSTFRISTLAAALLALGCSATGPSQPAVPVPTEAPIAGRPPSEWIRDLQARDPDAQKFFQGKRAALIRLAITGLGSQNPADRKWAACLDDYNTHGETALAADVGAALRDAVPPLARALEDHDLGVRWGAVWALGEIGELARPAVPAVAKVLRSREDFGPDDGTFRTRAANALGFIGGPQAVPVLLEATRDKDLRVRRMAVQSLYVVTDHDVPVKSVLPAMVGALRDDDGLVRDRARTALYQVRESVPSLIRDGDPAVREAALKAQTELRREE